MIISKRDRPNLSKRRTRGRICVRREKPPEGNYLSEVLLAASTYPGRVMITSRLADALEVEYEYPPPLDSPQTLFILDVRGLSVRYILVVLISRLFKFWPVTRME